MSAHGPAESSTQKHRLGGQQLKAENACGTQRGVREFPGGGNPPYPRLFRKRAGSRNNGDRVATRVRLNDDRRSFEANLRIFHLANRKVPKGWPCSRNTFFATIPTFPAELPVLLVGR